MGAMAARSTRVTGATGATRPVAFVGAALVVLVALLGLAGCTPGVSTGAAPPPGTIAADLLERHNAARLDAGLAPLVPDAAAMAHAQEWAAAMPAAAGGACVAVHSDSLDAWYPDRVAAENVACVADVGACPTDGAELMSMFLASPMHRANLLSSVFTGIGIGTVCSGGHLFAAVHFVA